MFNNQVRQRVKGLVAGVGPSIISNPDLLETKLADLATDNADDIRLIVSAARAGIPEEIASAPPEQRAELAQQAATWMASETGASQEAAQWAVETWTAAVEGVKIAPPADAAAAPQPTVLTPPPITPSARSYGAGAPPASWDTPRTAQLPSQPWGAPPPQPGGYGAPSPGFGGPMPGPPYGRPPAGGAWPPPPGGMNASNRVWSNSSGLQGDVPPEIAKLKWNWGAFGLPFWWLRSHNLRGYSIGWAVASFVVVRFVPGGTFIRLGLLLVVSILLGFLGHKLAWQNRTFNDVNHYFTVQKVWMTWALPLGILFWTLALGFLIFYASGAIPIGH